MFHCFDKLMKTFLIQVKSKDPSKISTQKCLLFIITKIMAQRFTTIFPLKIHSFAY